MSNFWAQFQSNNDYLRGGYCPPEPEEMEKKQCIECGRIKYIDQFNSNTIGTRFSDVCMACEEKIEKKNA